MRLVPLKFAAATGIALSVSFILCNIFLVILGKEITLLILNSIFHEIDFKPLSIEKGFAYGKLLHGTLFLFIAGALIGFITVFLYNLFSKEKSTSSENNSGKKIETNHHIGYKQ